MHPQLNPVAIQIGSFPIYWYGLMYLCGFITFLLLGQMRARWLHSFITPAQVSDLLFYAALGVIIGGRLGSVLFYNFDELRHDPFYILHIRDGGMSFHGGLLGVIVALWWYQKRHRWGLLRLCDFAAPMVPIGLGLGRIGNFINAELWGRPTDMPWGMVFPQVDMLPRHPSQLYQAFLEGFVLFAIVWWFSRTTRPTGAVAALFITLYGVFRFIIEFVREPDLQVGYIAFDWLTMGQLLSLPMIAVGAVVLMYAYRDTARSA